MRIKGKAAFKVETLGCKLNQFDSAIIEGELIKRNLAPAEACKDASIVIVNTCTVTNRADSQSRQLIRKIRRENPSCTIIVTGCYARLAPEALRKLPEANIVIDAADEDAARTIAKELEKNVLEFDVIESAASDPFEIHYTGKTRAFLKIQDGCDLKCSYCIIPRVRGKSRSIGPDSIIRNIRKLIDRGYREIVLTGINSGDYGKDLIPRTTLFDLLMKIIPLDGLGRIRLNSLEPPMITDDLIDLIASTDKIAHHLHVPLQSGCDRILKMMYRPYRTGVYSRGVERLRQRIPDIGIGSDVIVGFPGERDEDFEETFDFVGRSQINFLHVFPFSKRPDTPASKLPGELNGRIVKERSARLRKLGEELSFKFRKSFHHKILDAIVLDEKREDGRHRALSSNYIDIGIAADREDINTIVPVRVTRVLPDDTLGEISSPRR